MHQQAREAWHRGTGRVDFHGKSILVDAPFIQALDELVTEVLPPPSSHQEKPTPQGRYLLIHRNEDNLEYTEDAGGEASESSLTLPQALKPDVVLKDHQRIGVAWLQRNIHLGRRGCLWLTIWAWADAPGAYVPGLAHRTGSFIFDSRNADAAPWDPILIVMPVILLQNETWLEDMRKFFEETAPFLHLAWCYMELNSRKCGAPRSLVKRQRLATQYWTWSGYDNIVSS